MAWQKLGTETLVSSGDTITITGMLVTNFFTVLTHTLDTGGTIQSNHRSGNGTINSGTVYAHRRSDNGGTDATGVNSTEMAMENLTSAANRFSVEYLINIASKEKLEIGFIIVAGAVGAGNAPGRAECVNKWADTSDAIDQYQAFNGAVGSLNTDSNMSILGTD